MKIHSYKVIKTHGYKVVIQLQSHENTLLQSQAKKNSTAFKNCSTVHKSQKLSKCFPNQAKQQSFVHSEYKHLFFLIIKKGEKGKSYVSFTFLGDLLSIQTQMVFTSKLHMGWTIHTHSEKAQHTDLCAVLTTPLLPGSGLRK